VRFVGATLVKPSATIWNRPTVDAILPRRRKEPRMTVLPPFLHDWGSARASVRSPKIEQIWKYLHASRAARFLWCLNYEVGN